MRHFLRCALATAALALAMAGCGPLKPASPSMFFGNCITPPGPDPCSSDMEICQVFENVVNEEHASADACRAACRKANDGLYYQGYQLRDCGYMLDRGSSLCEQQCLRLYPATK